MENSNDIEISIIKGDKLFNSNTPFSITLTTPEPDENDKKCNADLICVIDVSGSMCGQKIQQVQESLKILLDVMDEKDRICLILFESSAVNYFNLNYLTKENKKILMDKINKIRANGGTDILSGLKIAIDVIKNQCNNEKNVSSILLLSDGCDNELNDIQLAEAVKNLTKGLGLSFTLNTFGYGDDHDAKIMNKLASIRDGSFFYVENYKKITEYFVSVLGGCISAISQKVDLNLQILNNNCKIMKVFGKDNLYNYNNSDNYFKTSMLQFICGKEYTFVLEIFVDEKNVKLGEELLKVEIIYEDISQNNKKIQKEKKYNYCLEDLQYSKANEEYIRVHVYDVLDEALKMKEKNQKYQGKKILEELENWLIKNNRGKNRDYIKDIQNAKGLFSEDNYIKIKSCNYVTSNIKEMSLNRTGNELRNCNKIQLNKLRSIPMREPIIQNEIPKNLNRAPLGKYPQKRYIPNQPINKNNNYIRINNNNKENKKEPIDNTGNYRRRNEGNLNRAPLPINNNLSRTYNRRIIELNRPNSSYQNNSYIPSNTNSIKNRNNDKNKTIYNKVDKDKYQNKQYTKYNNIKNNY